MPSDATEKAAVTAVIAKIRDSFINHHPEGIEECLDEHCTVWDVFEPELLADKATREAFHARDQVQSQARGPLTLRVEDSRIKIYGDMAVALRVGHFKYEPPNAAEGRVRVTQVLQKKDGAWKVVHHHEGLAPPGVPPTDEK